VTVTVPVTVASQEMTPVLRTGSEPSKSLASTGLESLPVAARW
jgi:hypothetical protein